MPALGLLEQPLVELLAPLDRRRAASRAARRAVGRPAAVKGGARVPRLALSSAREPTEELVEIDLAVAVEVSLGECAFRGSSDDARRANSFSVTWDAWGCSLDAWGCSLGAWGCSLGAWGCSLGAWGYSLDARGSSRDAQGWSSSSAARPSWLTSTERKRASAASTAGCLASSRPSRYAYEFTAQSTRCSDAERCRSSMRSVVLLTCVASSRRSMKVGLRPLAETNANSHCCIFASSSHTYIGLQAGCIGSQAASPSRARTPAPRASRRWPPAPPATPRSPAAPPAQRGGCVGLQP
eukprot:scaffold85746_cov68-Phaeocystis_antarctica.AAC.4